MITVILVRTLQETAAVLKSVDDFRHLLRHCHWFDGSLATNPMCGGYRFCGLPVEVKPDDYDKYLALAAMEIPGYDVHTINEH